MPKTLCLVLFLALVAELKADHIYGDQWETWMMPVGTALMSPSAIKLPVFDLLVFGFLGFAALRRQGGGPGPAEPLLRALWVSLACLAVWSVWGLVRGGSLQQILWQLHPFAMLLVMSFAIVRTCRKPPDFVWLGRMVVSAALYRATMVYVFCEVIKAKHLEPPPTMTTHGDTVLFVTGIVLLVVNALGRREARTWAIAFVASVYLVVAIHLNNRRIAWVSLGGALLLVHLMSPPTRLKHRLNRIFLVASPVVALYLVAGWGSTSVFFKPVGAISTMFGSHEDTSSLTRDIENYNLLQTAKSDPLLGAGWGHPYKEVSVAYSIAEFFAQYRYIPHNSVLGLVAFTGCLGFLGTWMVFPVMGYLAALTCRRAQHSLELAAGLCALVELPIYLVQMWGDMGFVSTTGAILMACAIGATARFSTWSGAWPNQRSMQPWVHVQDGDDVDDGRDRHPENGLAETAARTPVP